MEIMMIGRFEEACKHQGFCPAPYMTESMATRHCADGCCPDCGRFFQEEHPRVADSMRDILVTWAVDIPDTTPACAGIEQVHYRISHLGGRCCWKCQSYDIHTHVCGEHHTTIRGDAGHVCDLFRLDRSRYATLNKQAWEVRGKALQATMEDFR